MIGADELMKLAARVSMESTGQPGDLTEEEMHGAVDQWLAERDVEAAGVVKMIAALYDSMVPLMVLQGQDPIRTVKSISALTFEVGLALGREQGGLNA